MRHLQLCASVLLLGTALCAGLRAAAESEQTALATAQLEEAELTRVIAKASAAFVFVGGGSGVVVSPDGFILTNHHVAGDRKQWTVRIEGSDRMVVCDLAGTDPAGDLALLKCRGAENLPCVEFGDISQVRVGQQVLAVGDPFKLADLDGSPSFSLGTISALHRFQGNYSDAIQTDSAINPGNSGGPLLTLEGKLIGITGQIMSRFGAKANTGIGYAIPIDQILRFYPLLKEARGQVVYHGTLPDGLAFVSRPDDTQMAQVESVEPRSAAAHLGFRAGDRVVSAGGQKVYNYARLKGIIQAYPENSAVEIVLDRAGQTVRINLKLPRMQTQAGNTAYLAPIGVRLEAVRSGEGIRIASIEKDSPAEKAGLAPGDMLASIDGQSAPSGWPNLIAGKKPGEALNLRIRRSGPSGTLPRTLNLSVEIKR